MSRFIEKHDRYVLASYHGEKNTHRGHAIPVRNATIPHSLSHRINDEEKLLGSLNSV